MIGNTKCKIIPSRITLFQQKLTHKSFQTHPGISKQHHQSLQKASPTHHQPETKKTDKQQQQQASRKSLQEQDSFTAELTGFDSNKNNLTKGLSSKLINGTKVSKKLNLDEPVKPSRPGKLRNGLLKHRLPVPESTSTTSSSCSSNSNAKHIEIVDLDGEELIRPALVAGKGSSADDPLALTPKAALVARPPSPVFELAAMENIAERIKRRKNVTTTTSSGGAENTMTAGDLVSMATGFGLVWGV